MLNLDANRAVARNFGGSWTHRRRIIYGTLIFCAVCVFYLMLWGNDTSRLHETIANSAFFLAGGVIGSYVFGAVWDDKNLVASSSDSSMRNEQSSSGEGELVNGTAKVDNPD